MVEPKNKKRRIKKEKRKIVDFRFQNQKNREIPAEKILVEKSK
jgi:hypothetical protein